MRPPGHHATAQQALGFCLFNNVAIAARHALNHLGVERTLIADFDVHHGNGTQDAFYTEPRVLYFSVHQSPLYPGTGRIGERGTGRGEGANINVPLPPGCGDEEYGRVFDEVLAPAARRFQPQLILVSAGYDAHWGEMLASMQMTVAGFARMAGTLKGIAQELCQGRLVFTLEGGYHLPALAAGVRATLEVLLGSPEAPDPLGGPRPGRGGMNIDDILHQVKAAHGLGG